jgi:thioredoxin-related protein
MKNLFITLMLLVSTTIFAQDWQTNFEKAKEIATENNQKIILVFQGSDWCAPCIKLDNEIWSSNEFKAYAKDNYVMLKADFPRRKKNKLPKKQQNHNEALAEKYNQNGLFPLVVILDNTGKILGKTGYKKTSPKEYIALINKF